MGNPPTLPHTYIEQKWGNTYLMLNTYLNNEKLIFKQTKSMENKMIMKFNGIMNVLKYLPIL